MLMMGFAAVGLGVGVATSPGWLPRGTAIASAISEQIGFVLARYEVRGHRYTTQRDIEAALAIRRGTPLFVIDIAAATTRIEQLPWVRSAIVRRILPDTLSVEITERTAAALWRMPDADRLIDAEGRTLSAIGRGADVGLPVLSGTGAAAAAAGLLQALASNPRIAGLVVEARRIADRRWSLLLTGGTLVHLPGDGIDAALAWLESGPAEGLLEAGFETIDLRVSGQLVVRKGQGTPSQTAWANPPNLTEGVRP
jgi:cell division protein FtsQ